MSAHAHAHAHAAPADVDADADAAGVDLGTAGAVALALAAALGAVAAAPVPLWAGAGAISAGGWFRRPLLVVVGTGLLAAGLGHRAVAGLMTVEARPFSGVVELVTDPRPTGAAGWRGEVRLPDGERVRATAFGPAGWSLSRAGAGDEVELRGRLRPLTRRSAWTDSRHLVGVLDVDAVGPVRRGDVLHRVAGAVRAVVVDGATAVPERLQPLYLGLLVGDDRFQRPAQQAAFRVAGLTHLLAVSGQNVAFVLLAAGPLLRRLPTWPRFGAVLVVLVLFATVTRYEPSVLRATASAGLVAWSVALGRPNRGLRVLALAVAGLVLVDPLLVRSVGFQLSVLASAGILVLGPTIHRSLPGPRWVREPMSVTLAAQLAVLPLLTTVFGPVSVISVPANVAVSGAAGLVMTWGLTVGVVAGWLPDPMATALQLPASVSLWWIDLVARLSAAAPAPRVGAGSLVAMVAVLVLGRWWRLPRSLVVVGVALVLLATAHATGPGARELPGARWCEGGRGGFDVLVLHDAGRVGALIEALLGRGIRQVDVLILESGGRAEGRAMGELAAIVDVEMVLAPPQHQVRGARRVTSSLLVPGQGSAVSVEVVGPRALSVRRC